MMGRRRSSCRRCCGHGGWKQRTRRHHVRHHGHWIRRQWRHVLHHAHAVLPQHVRWHHVRGHHHRRRYTHGICNECCIAILYTIQFADHLHSTFFLATGSSSSESDLPPFFWRSWSLRSSAGMPSMPKISTSIFERLGSELGTLSTVSLCTCMQCMDSPGPVYNFLWQMWHLKCLAFWCCTRIFSSSNSRLQYLVFCVKS